MKKLAAILLSLTLLFSISGCAQYPVKADDGTEWNKDWEMMGVFMGVEPPGNNFTLLNNDTVLATEDTYYASWVTGEPTDFVNADGKDVDLYDAQIYLLVYGCKDADAASDAKQDWITREEESYSVLENKNEICNGQEFTFLLYDCISETNPYDHGVSAFGIFENYVISAELTCTEVYDGDAETILKEFLNGCHYSTERLQ